MSKRNPPHRDEVGVKRTEPTDDPDVCIIDGQRWRAAPADNGFAAAPERYTRQARETVDRMRDGFRARARERYVGQGEAPPDVEPTAIDEADFWFGVFCDEQARKYEDRAGAKGDPAGDIEKARWWREMSAHVRDEGPDPRHQREGFVPYEEAR